MQFRLTIAVVVALGIAAPVLAGPNPQLARSVAQRLDFYGIHVAPQSLTTAQAAALHLLMVGGKKRYFEVRSTARAILRNPDYRD